MVDQNKLQLLETFDLKVFLPLVRWKLLGTQTGSADFSVILPYLHRHLIPEVFILQIVNIATHGKY